MLLRLKWMQQLRVFKGKDEANAVTKKSDKDEATEVTKT